MASGSLEVIIPVRNMAEHLDRALPPLLDQMNAGDIVTVVNDSSDDDTEAVARRLGANVISIPQSRGPYFARQVAANRSSAELFLFVDARCRALPGLVDAHRQLQSMDGVVLSCTEVLIRTGSSLAGRVAARIPSMSLQTHVDVNGKLPFFATANLGIDGDAFRAIGGFRNMRSGADADICWRIQREGLGTLAPDRRVLMEWEPRNTLRDLMSQRHRYGKSTAYLEWVYGDLSPSTFTPGAPFYRKLGRRIMGSRRPAGVSYAEWSTSVFLAGVWAFGYLTAKRRKGQFEMPALYTDA